MHVKPLVMHVASVHVATASALTMSQLAVLLVVHVVNAMGSSDGLLVAYSIETEGSVHRQQVE